MAKKRDEGHEETEKVLADIEKEISKEYAQAEKEISEKLDDYLRRFEVKDKIKYNAWQEGKITEAEYKQWRLGQVAVGERWQEMKDSLAQDFTNVAEIGKSITDGHMPEIYAINHNYGTYQVEQTAHVDTSYTLYDRQSVEHLFKGEGKLYHDYGIKTGIAIAEGKQQAWDRKQIQSVMTQALLQGESIGKIATRLSKTVGDSDRKACIRNARTMTTGVQNAGRVDSYKRAESMGIELEQEWLATLDSRTRHEHRMLDGQRVKVGEKFKVDGYELAFPADPEGEAFLVYNCRCTLVPALKGFNVDSSDTSLRHTDYMNEQTYDEWKESHYIISDPITKQDDIAEIMKRGYNEEYRYLSGQSPSIAYPQSSISTNNRDVEQQNKKVYEMKPEAEGDYQYLKGAMNANNISYLEVKDLEKPLTGEQIVSKLAGGDMTGGSCASLAIAYCANKIGIDVTDYRGGDSRAVFSRNWKKALSIANANITSHMVSKEAKETAEILKTIQLDKEFVLVAGHHAAIVRRTAEKGLEYLEMQSNGIRSHNGWVSFGDNVSAELHRRFKCTKTPRTSLGMKIPSMVHLTDVDSVQNTKEFREILGYINTTPNKQKKGSEGDVR